jgi:hypothetical protein
VSLEVEPRVADLVEADHDLSLALSVAAIGLEAVTIDGEHFLIGGERASLVSPLNLMLPNLSRLTEMSRCGGPLIVQTNQGGYLQVGIIGGGVQCGDPTMPGTYARSPRLPIGSTPR